MCAVSLQSCPTLCDPMDLSSPLRLLFPWNSPSVNTGVDCHALLQGIFPTQGSNPHLLSPALAGRFFTTEPPGKPICIYIYNWITLLYTPKLTQHCKSNQLCVSMLSHFSHAQLFATLGTVAHRASLSMRFPRQEYWSGLPCPSPNPVIQLASLTALALAGMFFTTSATCFN